jgi:hypothetical protein
LRIWKIDDCRLRFETADGGLKVPMWMGPPSTIVNDNRQPPRSIVNRQSKNPQSPIRNPPSPVVTI